MASKRIFDPLEGLRKQVSNPLMGQAWTKGQKEIMGTQGNRTMKMTDGEKKRLAHIRKESRKWKKIDPAADTWNDAFLLKLLGRAMKK